MADLLLDPHLSCHATHSIFPTQYNLYYTCRKGVKSVHVHLFNVLYTPAKVIQGVSTDSEMSLHKNHKPLGAMLLLSGFHPLEVKEFLTSTAEQLSPTYPAWRAFYSTALVGICAPECGQCCNGSPLESVWHCWTTARDTCSWSGRPLPAPRSSQPLSGNTMMEVQSRMHPDIPENGELPPMEVTSNFVPQEGGGEDEKPVSNLQRRRSDVKVYKEICDFYARL